MRAVLAWAVCISVLALHSAQAQDAAASQQVKPQAVAPKVIEYGEYHRRSLEIEKLHEQRLIDIPKLLEMMKEKNTVVLDVRSKDDFARQHIAGSVNLDYAEITEHSLAKLVPTKGDRIILVCDESLSDGLSRMLALNQNAFPLVYQLGYENVYELQRLWRSKDPKEYKKMLPIVEDKTQ